MNITFQVPVVLKARPGRSKNDRLVYGYHPIVIDVPVIDAHEAPVVLSYKTSDHNGWVKDEEFRGFSGELYHAVKAKPSETVALTVRRHRSADGLFDVQSDRIDAMNKIVVDSVGGNWSQAAAKMHPQYYGEFIKHHSSEVELEPLSEMDLKGDFEREFDAQIEEFTNLAYRIVIIDGQFYLPEPEPLLRVVTKFTGVAIEAVRHAARKEPGLLAGQGLTIDTLGYFRFDETDRLDEVIGALANGDTVLEKVTDIAVYDERYLSVDSEALSLVEMAAVFRQYFAHHFLVDGLDHDDNLDKVAKVLAKLPLAQLALYQKLCDGIEAVKDRGDTEMLEEAVMTIMESDRSSMERHLFVYGGLVSRYAEIITDRWNNRPVETDLRIAQPQV